MVLVFRVFWVLLVIYPKMPSAARYPRRYYMVIYPNPFKDNLPKIDQ